MRLRGAVMAALASLSWLTSPAARGEKGMVRYGVTANLKSFPQATPKQALASVLKAVDLKRIDYLLAQLSDPHWVDERVKVYEGGFAELAKETAARLDASAVKKLTRFLKEGEFEILDGAALVRLKDVKDRLVRLRKIDGRWYLESRFK